MLAGVAAVIAFLGVVLVVAGLVRRQESPLEARVRRLAGHLPDEAGLDLEQPFLNRVVWPLIDGLGKKLSSLLPTAFVGRIKHLLMLAGDPFSLTGFLALMLVGGLGLPGLFLALALMSGAKIGSMQLLALLALLLLGFYLPYFWLARRVSKRQNEIMRSLPNALDLITISVEAGLGLDAAFAKVAEKLPGPFAEELAQALREMAMGRGRRDALREIGVRSGLPEVITFVNAIIHAETTGSSIGEVLRVQADQIRMKRRQRVEQTAQRMPIWMTFPLVLFLLPSLFIVVLGPAGIQVWDALVSGILEGG